MQIDHALVDRYREKMGFGVFALFLLGVALGGCDRSASQPKPKARVEPAKGDARMLPPDVAEAIAVQVRAGFEDKVRLLEVFCEELYEPGELDPAQVASVIDLEIENLAQEQRSWSEVTDCDRLEAAFAALNRNGIVALHDAGFTQSDGYDDFLEALELHPQRESVIGYCYYHHQDVERAIRGGGLNLAFGPVDPDEEQSQGARIGALVQKELEHVGLHVNWDGSFAKRLNVPDFRWQRR